MTLLLQTTLIGSSRLTITLINPNGSHITVLTCILSIVRYGTVTSSGALCRLLHWTRQLAQQPLMYITSLDIVLIFHLLPYLLGCD